MKNQITFKQSGKLASYKVEGDKIPVVLVHGFAEDGSIWEKQLQFLSTFSKVIIPDLPGSGDSELDPGGSIERYADVLREIIAKETDKPVIMIGHSMGGYITLAFAEKYPDSIRAIGLFHSSAYADDEEKIDTRRKAIHFIQTNGAKKFLDQSTPALFSEKTRTTNPALVEEILTRYANFKVESLVQYYESMITRPNRTKVLMTLAKPVLFILGVEDKAVPINKGLEQTHLPDICYIHICKNAGHMGMLEESEDCNMALEKFIKDVG